MRFYSLSYEELLAVPIRSFWFMNASIDRIRAQEDVRSLGVAACSQGGEYAVNYREKLVLEIGTVVTVTDNPMSPVNTQRDEAGFTELKSMANE